MSGALPYPGFISKQVLSGRYFFGHLDSRPDSPDLTVNFAGREDCSPDFHLVRSGFRYHAFEYIASGRWRLRVNGRDHTLEPGSVFGYTPATRFELQVIADRGGSCSRVGAEHTERDWGNGVRRKQGDSCNLIKYFVGFSGLRAGPLLARWRIADGTPIYLGAPHRIQEILDQLLDCAASPPASSAEMAAHLTGFLLLRIREEAGANQHPTSPAHNAYLRCRRYVENHFASVRTVEAVATACHLDPSYMCRLFREHCVETPYQLLVRLKMNRAVELLVLRHASVKEAAHAVSFDDPYHFSRVFKRTFGVAPKLFVRRILKHRECR